MGESFKDLLVWQRSVQTTVAAYKLTAKFPPDERFGLTNQMRRAAVSTASNVAEGYGRSSTGEYIQFLGIARESNCEGRTQLATSTKLGFGGEEPRAVATKLSEEVSRMLVAMMKKLRE